ncbi:hypothetical protein Ancab_032744 [Ancistrocladus abbreviatus]
MVKDLQAFPLAPSMIHQRSDEEVAFSNNNLHNGKIPDRSSRSSKCFVYMLAAFVLLFFLLLVFSLIVLQVKTPNLELTSASLKSLSYDYSPSFNITMLVKIAINNNNFGDLELDKNTQLSALYRSLNIGDSNNNNNAEFAKRRIGARKKEEISVAFKVRSVGIIDDPDKRQNLSNDVSSGVLEIGILARLSGKVNLLKNISKRAAAEMNCAVAIDLRSQVIQKLVC